MNDLAFAAIRAQLTASSNDVSRHAGTITTYAEVRNHLLGRGAIVAVIDKDHGEVRTFKRGSLMTWDFFRKSQDRTLRCSEVCKEQTIRRFFVEGIDLRI